MPEAELVFSKGALICFPACTRRLGRKRLADLGISIAASTFAALSQGGSMSARNTYSTEGLLPESSLGSWRDLMSMVYYSLDIVPVTPDRIRGRLTETQIDDVGLSHFEADAQRVVRHKSAAIRDGSENYVLLMPTCRPIRYEQLGRSGVVEPGEAVLLNSAEGYIAEAPDGSQNITLKVRCDRLRDRVPFIDEKCGRTNVVNRSLVPVVSQLGRNMIYDEALAGSRRAQEILLDLTCLMLDLATGNSIPQTQQSSLKTVMFRRLQQYVHCHLDDVSLSAEAVATRHRISVRYLHKVFQAHGTSFQRLLMSVRLEAAKQMLMRHAAGDGERVQIGEIAYRCGFANQAHFSTRFRKRFDCSPRDVSNGCPGVTGQRVEATRKQSHAWPEWGG